MPAWKGFSFVNTPISTVVARKVEFAVTAFSRRARLVPREWRADWCTQWSDVTGIDRLRVQILVRAIIVSPPRNNDNNDNINNNNDNDHNDEIFKKQEPLTENL